MTIQATGPRAIAIEKLAKMVSQSSTFQERLQVESEDEALKSVYWPYLQHVSSAKRPFAVVKTGPLRSRRGSTDRSAFSGSLMLILSDIVQSNDPGDAEIVFTNWADGIIDDLVNTLSGRDDNLIIQATDEEMTPSLSDPRKSTDKVQSNPYYMSATRIDWAPYLQ